MEARYDIKLRITHCDTFVYLDRYTSKHRESHYSKVLRKILSLLALFLLASIGALRGSCTHPDLCGRH